MVRNDRFFDNLRRSGKSLSACVLVFPAFLGRPSIVLPLKTVRWTVFGRRKDPGRSFGLCVGIPCLPGKARYCPAVKNSPVDCFRQKKRPKPERGSLCWHYLSSRAVARQVLSAQMSLTSVFGMGTGGPSSQSIPTYVDGFSPSLYVKRFLV